MSKDDHWLNNSVVSRIARGPGFESRSGHDFFLPCDIHLEQMENLLFLGVPILKHIRVSVISTGKQNKNWYFFTCEIFHSQI